jgi:uncharacterized protein
MTPPPRPTGPPPSLEEPSLRRDEILRIAPRHGARSVRAVGSLARGEAGAGSDLDVLVDTGGGASLLTTAALQNDLEDLLGCPVHVVTTSGRLKYTREHVRAEIEGEAVPL